MEMMRERLENNQIIIYFAVVVMAAATAWLLPWTSELETAINPALALMLFVTFLQMPVTELSQAAIRVRFLIPLLLTNFVAVPLLVAILIQFLPTDPILIPGVLLVLLTPCIDYVVTFSQFGQADSRLLLASTPILLIMQILLLPIYLRFFLSSHAVDLVRPGPFLHAFMWLIAAPLCLAALTQFWAGRSQSGKQVSDRLKFLPVPATALVLFIVVTAMVPQLGKAAAGHILPMYTAFAVTAPFVGWAVARLFQLDTPSGRAVAFSAATLNSLVVLPLALAVPGTVPVLPAVIVTQTMVELVSELIYIRLIPKLGQNSKRTTQEKM
ncbi:arsenic resistance protein [Xenorhabdus budapestensis]|uniref:Arsenic resistance protein n=1 Tax=Xenorhabdus budapestensis TaxID=290110 RepID=A0A2D0IV42_XENBU|nr:arsenic resistance protein [Xenorhabdus budapestensis]PHM25749.1 arsenic resistance protein [Xenorhabdus budapestensis]